MCGGVTAPFNGHVTLCQDVRILHLIGSLGLHHQDLGLSFCNKIWLTMTVAWDRCWLTLVR